MPQQKKETQEEAGQQGEAQETQTQEEATSSPATSTPASANPHINRNREISALLREGREERNRARLLAENRKLKAELEQLKAQQSGGGDS